MVAVNMLRGFGRGRCYGFLKLTLVDGKSL